jgi:hypothetical protein
MLEACRVLKKVFSGRLVGRSTEGRQRKRLSEDVKMEGWEAKAEVGRQGREITDEVLHHNGVSK